MSAKRNSNYCDKLERVALQQTAVTYNPYGSTVFIAVKTNRKDKKGNPIMEAQQVFVTPGLKRGDQVAIMKGLEPGMTVITSGRVKLKNAPQLILNNSVLPANSHNTKTQEI